MLHATKASLVIIALSVIATLGHAETYTYRLTEVGKGFATAINKSGHVTGSSRRNPCCGIAAFLWTGKQPATQILESLIPDDPFPVTNSEGADINNEGLMVVNGVDANNDPHAYLWDGTSAALRPVPDDPRFSARSTEGRAINESGHVAGVILANDGIRRAFLWNGVTLHNLGPGQSNDVNGSGQVTGFIETNIGPGEARGDAFLWDGDNMHNIGTLGGAGSYGQAINGKGQITGTSYTPNNVAFHAFLWDGGLMTDLGTLEGYPHSFGLGVNNAGQIVGTSRSGPGTRLATCRGFKDRECRPFLWEKGMMRNLNDLVDPNDPLKPSARLKEGIAINGLGQIVVRGINADDKQVRDYVLSPHYRLTSFLAPTASTARRGTTVRVAVGLLDAENVRIPDSRAATLASSPCRVQVRANGAQTLQKACMTYDAGANQFFFDWRLSSAGTGTATVEVRVNYGAPGPLKVLRTKNITITN